MSWLPNSICSGDMYAGEPTNWSAWVSRVRWASSARVAFAMPKSITFGMPSPSWNDTRMFVGLRSRWMMPFWWRVLDGLAHESEEAQPGWDVQALALAVLGDRDAADELHHEVRPPLLRCARVEDPRDARVVHQREGLALRVEAPNDLLRVHPQLEDLQRNVPPHRLFLLGVPHDAEATLAEQLQQPIRPDARARFEVDGDELDGLELVGALVRIE